MKLSLLKLWDTVLPVQYLLRCTLLAVTVGIPVGSASALFLTSLDWATQYRESNPQIFWVLPIAGLAIGLSYHYAGKRVAAGNNLLLHELHTPQRRVPLLMAPLILLATVVTHLFGGSAGREGTAVQIGGTMADQLSWWRFSSDRRLLLTMGMGAGFSSVFGTPLAGTLFALEVGRVGQVRYLYLLPTVLSALIADCVCRAWQIPHTHYYVATPSAPTPLTLLHTLLSGMAFGGAAWAFIHITHTFTRASSVIPWPPLRPAIGGAILTTVFVATGATEYAGLGIPTILSSFESTSPWYHFAIKLLLTGFTLGVGFKGGEATPLFFIGATLGSAISAWSPLPTDLLAGIGFAAVFAAATNTPLASTLMGIELFGAATAPYLLVACSTAYFFAGRNSVYSAQLLDENKYTLHSDKNEAPNQNL